MIITAATAPVSATDWQISLSVPGAVVTDLDSVAQSLKILLSTEPRSVPMMPDFGIGLLGLIGKPIAIAARDLKQRTIAQLQTYLPAVTVTACRVSYPDPSQGQIAVTVVWSYRGNSQSTTVTA